MTDIETFYEVLTAHLDTEPWTAWQFPETTSLWPRSVPTVSDESDDNSAEDEDITVSDIETIDSAADFKLEVCYFIFTHLKKVIGWTSPFLRIMEIVLVISVAYWSTVTALSVGYGDYRGLNFDEIRFSILVMLLGSAITNGLVVGSLTSLLTNVESQRASFAHRLMIIKRYLQDNKYSTELSETIQGFYEYMWFKKRGQSKDNIYEALPPSLQSEICLSVNHCALSRSPMFRDLDEGFLRSIALKIQNHFYLPGQIVINKGTVSRCMYYVVRGELEVLSDRDNQTPVAVLRPGKLFGEVNLVLNFARTATIRAATHSATMSTTGYGDIVALNTIEYCISILCMVLGLVLFSYTLASYASLLTNIDRPKVQFQSIVFAMEQFMVENRLDRLLRKRVLRYMDVQWNAYDGLIMPGSQSLLHDLPDALKQDLAADGIVRLLDQVPLFHSTDTTFRQELSTRCSRYLFPPNELVLYSGDLGRDMYVIIRGYCESYIGKRQKSLGLMGPGEYFGEAGMLFGLPRPAHVITRTHCCLLAIPHGEFQRIMKKFPTVNMEIREIQDNAAILRTVKLNHARVWRLSKELPPSDGLPVPTR
ncbi:Cyclic nucleotide-gated cation channel [Amphibalanus amphitrite]|uniref:Cyclic nucleotide-gated cation channel n=1 Tax=Amphibalanus amphitrite TaxID=1232801 RepID=A0A6A4WZK4_AMPAM|nr:Cyclic nucleotide-gated cation channel [Amphibalanus amphitrite]